MTDHARHRAEAEGERASIAGVPSDNTTLVSVLAGHVASGWTGDMAITDDGRLRCLTCRAELDPADVRLDGLHRLEGASDPADMLCVLAVTCPRCATKATAIARYGPEAPEGHGEVLLAVEDRRGPTGVVS